MCVVSVVHDYYRGRLPLPWENQADRRPWWPNTAPYSPVPDTQPGLPPVNQWDAESVRLLREALDRLEKLDKRLGDKECADPAKTKWFQDLEHRIAQLEQRPGSRDPLWDGPAVGALPLQTAIDGGTNATQPQLTKTAQAGSAALSEPSETGPEPPRPGVVLSPGSPVTLGDLGRLVLPQLPELHRPNERGLDVLDTVGGLYLFDSGGAGRRADVPPRAV